ncbi:alpha/beta hydrolase [Breznakia pachnodae]|uniref:Acetyl esterase/lipase n=1 Tax=Breznakia pachnodae TaxID=265178 RepID=A0ABU0E4M3_9FIRM|nr:alpha/beta hydrolase [Breznakia pachnodae]MDQ0361822.1 acetyl esterase/lipase [Breznakia pachnodae]
MKEKKYSDSLVKAIKEKQYVENINGMNVIQKPIPDCDIKGAMDPRLYDDQKKMATMMRFMPKGLMKMDASPKSIERLRKMFNGVKSIPVTSDAIETKELFIKGKDDNDIPITVYLPLERKENLSTLYYIHGGGFFGGHRGVVDQLVRMIVEKFNIVAVSIEYRLAPENPYPKGHEDCYEGLKWVYKHISEYSGNPNNIFVAGDSAGGNLAQYCTTRDLEDNSHMVRGQMLLYPTVNMAGIDDEYSHWSIDKYNIYDKHKKVLTASLSMMGGDNGMTSMLGSLLGTTDIMNNYLTPYMMDPDNLPPTLITVGEHDFLYIECLAYARKLNQANVDTTTIVYKGMGHAYGDNIGVYPQSEDCALELGNFIEKYTK